LQPHEILTDPLRAIELRWGSSTSCPCKAQIDALIDEIAKAKPEVKRLKVLKQGLSRQFSDPSLSAQDLNLTKQKVGEVSAKIKQLEAALKQSMAKLRALFEDDPDIAALPPRYHQTSPVAKGNPAAKLELATPMQAGEWDSYVAKHPRATIYHRFDWKNTLERAHQVKGFYVIAKAENNDIVGVLPTFNLCSRLFGNFLVSLPYMNYGGPLADSVTVEQQLLDHAAKIATEQGARHFEARCMHEVTSWPKKCDKVSMLLQLPASSALLDQQLGSKLRAQIKQCRQHQLHCQFGNLNLLDDFYSVFSQNMRDLGTPVYGKPFFREILMTFPKAATIAVTYSNKQPVAAGFLLGSGDTLEIPWASALRKFNHLQANMFMYRSVLDYAIEQDFSWFDFGRSTLDAPTYRFKKQWGAKPITHHWHYWLPDGHTMPQLNPNNPKYKIAISIWKKIPVWLTKIIGPPIVKNLP